MGNTQTNDIYINEPHPSDLCDSRSLIGTWRDTKYGSCMSFDYIYNGKSSYLIGTSSTGAYAQVRLNGAIVDLVLMLADGCSLCQYKGLLEINNDDKQTHTIRWIKKNIKNGQWYTTSSWMKI
ncbi:unnamed protein product [Adineta steineri]|uniref:Uncharacterized protein n=1 Tax=Adineta steineri TaxID=433720 RepID=A0A816C6I6_9BILA|nr:unnamed protein product [Adineta steineri]CAF1617691.1 unnamed protein product [Adineta steineri]